MCDRRLRHWNKNGTPWPLTRTGNGGLRACDGMLVDDRCCPATVGPAPSGPTRYGKSAPPMPLATKLSGRVRLRNSDGSRSTAGARRRSTTRRLPAACVVGLRCPEPTGQPPTAIAGDSRRTIAERRRLVSPQQAADGRVAGCSLEQLDRIRRCTDAWFSARLPARCHARRALTAGRTFDQGGYRHRGTRPDDC